MESAAVAKSQPLAERARTFESLVKRYHERAVRLAYIHLGDWDEARDVAQEAFMKAYEALDRFRGEAAMDTWLYRIVVNTALKRLRKRRWLHLFKTEEAAYELEDKRHSPAEEVDLARAGKALMEALPKLAARQRSAFVLKHFEHMTAAQIADVMGIAENTVKVHLHRAYEKLRRVLKEYRP